jgi:hypothetical protein
VALVRSIDFDLNRYSGFAAGILHDLLSLLAQLVVRGLKHCVQFHAVFLPHPAVTGLPARFVQHFDSFVDVKLGMRVLPCHQSSFNVPPSPRLVGL